jgi:hypothetical protein
MPNGKLFDHPLTDILFHRQDVYSPRAANLVREIATLADEKTLRELGDLLVTEYNDQKADVLKLEEYLTSLRDKLARDAWIVASRGTEVRCLTRGTEWAVKQDACAWNIRRS